MAGQPNPINERYLNTKLCPVNVHWHLGAEHRSAGEYDETGTGPAPARRRLAGGKVRQGHQCKYYNKDDPKFTTPYKWKFCKNMEVGQTSMKDIVRQATVEIERELIIKALNETRGNVTRAAHLLQISRKGLQNKMKEFGLREPETKS